MNDIRPIHTEADYEATLAIVERLRGSPTGTPEGDRLDVLATLIDAYESAHYPIDPPDPIEAIKFRMEQQNLTGVRSITMIRNLHEKLGIPAEVLIRASPPDRAAALRLTSPKYSGPTGRATRRRTG